MSQNDKGMYFRALKASGLEFEKHYREYNTAELKAAYEKLAAAGGALPLDHPTLTAPRVAPPPPRPRGDSSLENATNRLTAQRSSPTPDPEAAAFFGFRPEPEPVAPAAPVAPRNPEEMAGERLNTKDLEEPIRTDEHGKVWLQEEVRKPAYPKPRGRRVLKYMDPGVERKQVKAGDYIEEFEVAGDMANARPSEVKITLPSYQVGIYRDPRYPFKVICYNDNEGFDLEEIRAFYGGSELVPGDVKLKYVENTLCYDMRSVIRAVESEYRSRVLGQHG